MEMALFVWCRLLNQSQAERCHYRLSHTSTAKQGALPPYPGEGPGICNSAARLGF
jgi:hypothetical protein